MGFTKLAVAMTLVLSISLSLTEAQKEANFKCSGGNATCRALISYLNPNGTTLGEIRSLFNVKHLVDMVGANNLPSNSTKSYKVGPNQYIKVPFPCRCRNGTGLSNGVPLYKIKKGDTLYDIATTTFAGLVKYPQIQVANNLPDANNITAGDTLYIPLPCSCDAVAGNSVVHYAHLVASGSSVDAIAVEFGTTQQILLSLNGITDPKSLEAGQILDVPLRACSSSVKNGSIDYPLLVANATYAYTANECVKCKCESSNNYVLQCEPSNLKPTNWSVCPSAQCSSSVFIGNITSTTDSCNRTTCAYTGYTAHNISAELVTQNICAVPPSGESGGSNGGARSAMQGLLWSNLFIVIHFVLFLVYVL